MSSRPAGAPGDVATPETFRSTVTSRQILVRMIPLFVMLFVFSSLLFGGLLLMAGWFVGVRVPGLFGVLVAALYCGLQVLVTKRRLDEKGQQTVTFSPTGAVLSDGHMRVELPWTHVRSIGEVEVPGPVRTRIPRFFPPLVAMASGAAQAVLAAGTRKGLVGSGRLSVSPEAPKVVKKQVKQFLDDGPADPRIGQRPMGIPLMVFDTDWENGRIGQWVRTYRPDLLG